jgi:hypothetical protein
VAQRRAARCSSCRTLRPYTSSACALQREHSAGSTRISGGPHPSAYGGHPATRRPASGRCGHASRTTARCSAGRCGCGRDGRGASWRNARRSAATGSSGPGEDCDDANDGSGDCCVACRAEPGCWIPCERTADCAPYAVCWRRDDTCRATTGVCRPPYPGQCPPNQFPTCGCDGRAYASECAAWEAGVTVQGGDGLNQPTGRRCRCRPASGRECGAGRVCRVAVSRFGGICADVDPTPRR